MSKNEQLTPYLTMLYHLRRVDLQSLCNFIHSKISGTKVDMLDRIKNYMNEHNNPSLMLEIRRLYSKDKHVDSSKNQITSIPMVIKPKIPKLENLQFEEIPYFKVIRMILPASPINQPYSFESYQLCDGIETGNLIQLRIGVPESGFIKDQYPTHLQVKINRKLVDLPPCLPIKRQNEVPKRPRIPVTINNWLYSGPHVKNNLISFENQSVNKNFDDFYASIVMVKKLSVDDLLRQIQSRSMIPIETTRRSVRERLTCDSDMDEPVMTEFYLSLLCPISQARLEIPVRSSRCLHLQCFDAKIFLTMNEKRPNWRCPVCSRMINFMDFQIDEYMTRILGVTKDSVKSVCFDKSGDWYKVNDSADNYHNIPDDWSDSEDQSKPKKQKEDAEVIVIEDSDEEVDNRNGLTLVEESARTVDDSNMYDPYMYLTSKRMRTDPLMNGTNNSRLLFSLDSHPLMFHSNNGMFYRHHNFVHPLYRNFVNMENTDREWNLQEDEGNDF